MYCHHTPMAQGNRTNKITEWYPTYVRKKKNNIDKELRHQTVNSYGGSDEWGSAFLETWSGFERRGWAICPRSALGLLEILRLISSACESISVTNSFMLWLSSSFTWARFWTSRGGGSGYGIYLGILKGDSSGMSITFTAATHPSPKPYRWDWYMIGSLEFSTSVNPMS